MKVYFQNKLGGLQSYCPFLIQLQTVELEKDNMIEEFVSKIQDNGGTEKVRVNIITSSCNCDTGLTDFLLQDLNKEITLVNVIEPDDSLSNINTLYEEFRFKDI